jgi:asparagine synthetase B (glutamine-hydrolysing)
MPGIVGCLNSQAGNEALTADAAPALNTNGYQKIEQVTGVRQGNVYIVHPDINPVGHGCLHEEGTGRIVAFWGEFYGDDFNLCETGSEVCATLLKRLGQQPLAALRELDGSFVLFYQAGQSQLLAADRTASRPIFYMQSASELIFAPEPKAFSYLSRGKPRLNHDAMVSFLVNGHPISDATYFDGVRLLRPGHYIEVNGGRITSGEYAAYSPAGLNSSDMGLPAYREQLATVLRAAVRNRSKYLDKAVFPVSGGYDSRGLLACVREFHTGRIRTVSWGTGEEDPTADAAIGRRVAAYFDCDHLFLRRRSDLLIEGLQTTVHLIDAANTDSFIHPHEPTLIEELRNMGHPVLFRGDESFGYRGTALSGMEAMARVGLRELSQYPSLHGLFHQNVLPGILEEQQQTFRQVIGSCPTTEDWTIAKDWLYLNQRLFRSLNFSHYAKLCFLEARNPWLDRDVLRVYENIPVKYRIDKMLYRETLAFMFPDVMSRIPIAQRSSLENWAAVVRTDAKFEAFARKHLVESDSPIHAIWSPAAIGRWIDQFYSGKSSEPVRTRLIDAAKGIVRKNLRPVYSMLKKAAPRQLAVRPFAPEDAIGRLLILKLWCDKWA